MCSGISDRYPNLSAKLFARNVICIPIWRPFSNLFCWVVIWKSNAAVKCLVVWTKGRLITKFPLNIDVNSSSLNWFHQLRQLNYLKGIQSQTRYLSRPVVVLKNFQLCKFFQKATHFYANLRRNMKYTHLFGKFTHLFPQIIKILHFLLNFNQGKDKNCFYWNLPCFIVSKKSYNLHVFTV